MVMEKIPLHNTLAPPCGKGRPPSATGSFTLQGSLSGFPSLALFSHSQEQLFLVLTSLLRELTLQTPPLLWSTLTSASQRKWSHQSRTCSPSCGHSCKYSYTHAILDFLSPVQMDSTFPPHFGFHLHPPPESFHHQLSPLFDIHLIFHYPVGLLAILACIYTQVNIPLKS